MSRWTIIPALLLATAVGFRHDRKVGASAQSGSSERCGSFPPSSGGVSLNVCETSAKGLSGTGLVGSGKGRVHLSRILPLAQPRAPGPAMGPAGKYTPVSSAEFSPDGKLLAWTTVFEIHLWRLGEEREFSTIPSPFWGGELACLAFSPDGRELATGALRGKFGGCRHAIDLPSAVGTQPFSLAGTPDQRRQGIALWEVKTGRMLRKLDQRDVWAIAFSPEGKLLAAGSNVGRPFRGPKLVLWDVATGRPVWGTFADGKFDSVLAVRFSPDGSRIVASNAGKAYVLDVRTGRVLRQLSCDHSILCLAFSPDGTFVAGAGSGGGGGACIWDAATGRAYRELDAGSVVSLAFSPDSREVATGSWDNRIRLWELRSGRLARTLTGHSGYVSTVAFSPDGKFVASGSGSPRDSTVRLWDSGTGREVREFGPSKNEPGSCGDAR